MTKDFQNEIDAIKKVHDLLEPLEQEVRERVIKYVLNSLGISFQGMVPQQQNHVQAQASNPSNADVVNQTSTQAPVNRAMDIRTLKETKAPKS